MDCVFPAPSGPYIRVTRLLVALAVCVAAAAAWLLTGLGGATVQHYLGLLADGPANLAATIIAAAAARHLPRGLARAVVSLGETLGIATVAEGIETESLAAALLALGCVPGQGFLFAKADSLDHLSTTSLATRLELSA